MQHADRGRLHDDDSGRKSPKRIVPILAASELAARTEPGIELTNSGGGGRTHVHRGTDALGEACGGTAFQPALAHEVIARYGLVEVGTGLEGLCGDRDRNPKAAQRPGEL